MSQVILLLPIIVPALFWAGYHYYKDRHLPEPVGRLLAATLLGALAAGLSRVLYLGLGEVGLRYDAYVLAQTDTMALLAYALLAIGPIEELAKMLPFVLVVRHFGTLDEPVDGIIYASFIALGYAAVENWHYLEYLTGSQALARGFASPVVHIVFASIWGHLITRAQLAGRRVLPAALGGLLIAAGLHGIYDFVVILEAHHSLPIAAIIIVAAWLWRLRLIRTMLERAAQDR